MPSYSNVLVLKQGIHKVRMRVFFRFGLLALLIFLVYTIVVELRWRNSVAEFEIVQESEEDIESRKKFAKNPPERTDKIQAERERVGLEPMRDPIQFENTKKILIYSATKFFGMDVTTKRFLSNCHSTKGYCELSENPADLERAHAVIFHNADYSSAKVPKTRKPDRPHVLWSLESQSNDGFRPEAGVINWTMTPLKHSDIWMPYGHTEKRKLPVFVPLDDIWAMKTAKIAIWLASNCHTANRRLELINRIVKTGVDSDLFGRCGKPAPGCDGVDKQGETCVKELVRKYKFYYAIENSNCKDYVTEKFWAALYDRYAVPIVLDRKRYEAVGAPPNSFIAIDDFETIVELVKHLNKVAASKEEYLKYHEWRNTHVVFEEHDDGTGFCELCRALQKTPLKFNFYNDIRAFQSPEKQCNQNYADRFLP